MADLCAGAAATNISPRDSQFLYGYPHVARFSTGVHDPLFSSALYLSNEEERVLFIANDVIFVGREPVLRTRRAIAEATGLPESAILVSASHTHSGPVTVNYVSNEADAAVPGADPAYLTQLEDGIVEAGIRAYQAARPAEAGFALASGAGLGANRRDPHGPADPEIPVLLVRDAATKQRFACMMVCAMHPTVLHEDSTAISGDFPGLARQYLQRRVLGTEGVVLYHMGAAGNQSPRHVTRANTIAEARRLGEVLGGAVEDAVSAIPYVCEVDIHAATAFTDLPPAAFPSVREAEQKLRATRMRLENLRRSNAPRQETRTAECDWFGAEETVTLSRAAAEGRLDAARKQVLPAEIQLLRVGPWRYIGWPGEIFVEYALELRAEAPGAYLITLANGELQGYIVTREAAAEGGYEASNALFAPESGAVLLARTRDLLQQDETIQAVEP